MKHTDVPVVLKEIEVIEQLKREEHIRWINSPEFERAWEMFAEEFRYSPQYRNARLAYRRRVNGSPSAETT